MESCHLRINMYKHVYTVYIHVWTSNILCYGTDISCTWFIHVHTFHEMYKHVYTSLYIYEPWQGETDFQNASEMHTKHCVLEKDSLNPLRFAKRGVVGSEISRERPSPWFSEASGLWQKNARGGPSTSVPILYTVGQVCRLSLTLGRPARATDAIWLPNV